MHPHIINEILHASTCMHGGSMPARDRPIRASPRRTLKPPAYIRTARFGWGLPYNAGLYQSAERSRCTCSGKPETNMGSLRESGHQTLYCHYIVNGVFAGLGYLLATILSMAISITIGTKFLWKLQNSWNPEAERMKTDYSEQMKTNERTKTCIERNHMTETYHTTQSEYKISGDRVVVPS